MKFLKALIAFAWISTSFAQTQSPKQNPEPAPPEATQDDSETAQISSDIGEPSAPSQASFVRLWYFGDSASSRITVRAGEDERAPVLASHVRAGSLKFYREVPSGSVNFQIFSGDLIPDDQGRLKTDTAPLATVAHELGSGAYATLIITNQRGALSAEVLDDKLPSDPETISLRIMDYSSEPEISLWIQSNPSAPIWSKSQGTPFSVSSLRPESPTTFFQLRKNQGDELVDLSLFELPLKRGMSGSVVVFTDRYDRVSMTAVEDAMRR